MRYTADMLKDAPDLAGLESVSYTERFSLIAGIIVFLVCTAIALPSLCFLRLFGDMIPLALISMLILLAVGIWSLHGALTHGYRWTTSQDGIEQRLLLGRKYIKWVDVDSAIERAGRLASIMWQISGKGTTITLMRDHSFQDRAVIEASIFQHLRRCGKAGSLLFSDDVASFWDSILEEVPHEMTWNCKQTWDWLYFPSLFGLWSLFLLVISILSSPRSIVLLIISLSLLSITPFLCLRARKGSPAKTYTVDRDGITAEWPKRAINIKWNEVDAAKWGIHSSIVAILIKSGEHLIPVPFNDNKDEDLGRFILCVIRHLRYAGVALSIPTNLRVPAVIPLSDPGEVSCRLPRLARYSVTGGYGFLLLTLWIHPKAESWSHNPSDLSAQIVVSIGVLLMIVAAQIWRLGADKDGIRKRTIFGCKHISWSEVTSYKRVASRQSGYVLSIALKNAKGRSLLRTDNGISLTSDWEKLVACIDANLKHLLPKQEDAAPWLAVPWKTKTE